MNSPWMQSKLGVLFTYIITCCCFGAFVHTLPFVCYVGNCIEMYLLFPDAAIPNHTHVPFFQNTSLHNRRVMWVYFILPPPRCSGKYTQNLLENYVSKNSSLTILHMCTYFAVCHSRQLNTRIASCIPQTQLLRCISSYYCAKVHINSRKLWNGLVELHIILYEKGNQQRKKRWKRKGIKKKKQAVLYTIQPSNGCTMHALQNILILKNKRTRITLDVLCLALNSTLKTINISTAKIQNVMLSAEIDVIQ